MLEHPQSRLWLGRRAARRVLLQSLYVAVGVVVALAGALGIVATFSSHPLLTLAELSVKWLNDKVSLAIILGMSEERLVRIVEPASIGVAALILAVILFAAKSGPIARHLEELFFAEFNYGLFLKIGRPRGIDPLRGPREDEEVQDHLGLDWIEPSGQRRMIWDACLQFVKLGIGKRRTASRATATGPFIGFSWIILVGRAGAGKSRTATQCARSFASRERHNEDHRKSWRRRLPAFLRLRLAFLTPRVDDPWDAGEIRIGYTADNSDQLRAHLATWKPRRPTVLILDDPPEDWVTATVFTLHNGATHIHRPYRHPVRLFIVNQTVPSTLNLSARPAPTGSDAAWIAAPPNGFSGQVLAFSEDAEFGSDEIRQALTARFSSNAALVTAAHDQVLRLGGGNPLLLELAISWLNEGRPVAEMSRAKVVANRVDRVLAALEKARFGDVFQHQALACATLAGGAPQNALLNEFPGLRLEPLKLRAAFPADRSVNLDAFLPAVRPDLVGDAFVQRIVHRGRDEPLLSRNADEKRAITELSEALARKLVEVAWRANPGGLIRTLGRYVRREDRAGDVVAGALATLDVARCTPDRSFATLLIRTLIDALCRARPLTPQLPLPIGWLHLVRETAPLVPPEGMADAILTAEQVADPTPDDHPDGEKRGDRAQPILALFGARLGADDGASGRDSERIMAISLAWRLRRCAPTPDQLLQVLAWGRSLEPATDATARLARLRALALAMSPIAAAGDLPSSQLTTAEVRELCALGEAPSEDLQLVGAVAATALLRAAVTAKAPRKETLSLAAAATASLKPNLRGRDVDLERATVLTLRAYMDRREPLGGEAEAFAMAVDELARAYPIDPDFELERAKAWRAVASSLSLQGRPPSDVRAIADKVEAIARGFTGRPVFAIERARAWRDVAHSESNRRDRLGPPSTRACAELVDQIAAAFPTDPGLQLQRVRAWGGCVAYAYSRQEGAAEEAYAAARRVDRIARAVPENSSLLRYRAEAWRHVARALRDLPDGRGAQACRRAAARVSVIARRVPGHELVQREAVQAWRCAATACARVPEGFAMHDAQRLAEHVERLVQGIGAADWAAEERALLWRQIAEGWARLSDSAGANSARRSMERLRALVLAFPKSAIILAEFEATAFACANAHLAIPHGRAASRLEVMARRVARLRQATVRNLAGLARAEGILQSVAAGAYSVVGDEAAARAEDRLVAANIELLSAFPDDNHLTWNLLLTYASAVTCFGKLSAGSGAQRAASLTRQMGTLADEMAALDARRQFAMAAVTTTIAFASQPDGAGAADAETWAGEIGRLARGPAPSLADDWVYAMSVAAAAYAEQPNGRGAADADRMSAQLGACAVRFATVPEILSRQANSLRSAAKAHAGATQANAGAHAEARADQILALVPLGLASDIADQQVAGALSFAASAFARAREPLEASRVAERVQSIADRHPSNEAVQQALAGALSVTAEAGLELADPEQAVTHNETLTSRIRRLASDWPGDRAIAKCLAAALAYTAHVAARTEKRRTRLAEIGEELETLSKAWPSETDMVELVKSVRELIPPP